MIVAFILLIFLLFCLLVTLIVGMVNPSLVLRWDKRPTRLKLFIYWLISTIIIIILLGLVGILKDINNSDTVTKIVENNASEQVEQKSYNYGIITQKIGSKVMIDAFYDAEIYKKDNIAEVIWLINKKVKEKTPDKTININLYPSERIGKTDRTQMIAQSGSYTTDNNPVIDYYDDKINALNSRSKDKDYIELEKFLNEHNTSLYEINSEINKISLNVLREADAKYDYTSSKHGEFQEKRELEEVAKLFAKYNIPDSLDVKIYALSIYCK